MDIAFVPAHVAIDVDGSREQLSRETGSPEVQEMFSQNAFDEL